MKHFLKVMVAGSVPGMVAAALGADGTTQPATQPATPAATQANTQAATQAATMPAAPDPADLPGHCGRATRVSSMERKILVRGGRMKTVLKVMVVGAVPRRRCLRQRARDQAAADTAA